MSEAGTPLPISVTATGEAFTGNIRSALDTPLSCCDACMDTNRRIREIHSFAEQFLSQMKSDGGPMGLIMKMMSGR